MNRNLLFGRIGVTSMLVFSSMSTYAQSSDYYPVDSIIDAVNKANNVYYKFVEGPDETIGYTSDASSQRSNYEYYDANGYLMREECYELNTSGEPELKNYSTYEYEDNNRNIYIRKDYVYGSKDWYLVQENKTIKTINAYSYSYHNVYSKEYNERGNLIGYYDCSKLVYDDKGYALSGESYESTNGNSYKRIYTPTYNDKGQASRTDIKIQYSNGTSL